MTENKRFSVAESSKDTMWPHGIRDNERKVVYNSGLHEGFLEDIVDLLNEQHEEIVELREAMKRLMGDLMSGGLR